MIKTTQFVRKPLYVDAIQITVENFVDVAEWCQGDIFNSDGTRGTDECGELSIAPLQQYIRVRVHNPKSPRQTKGYVNDWILYADRGYKVYTNKAFLLNFDPAGGEDEPNPDQLSTEVLKESVV